MNNLSRLNITQSYTRPPAAGVWPLPAPNRGGKDEVREKLLGQLLATEGENLNRLCTIVSRAGFEILFYDEKGNAVTRYGRSNTRDLAIGGLTPRVLHRVREYIDGHLAENVELDAMANLTGLSRSHFSRAFKKSVGIPPHNYLMQRRLEHAQKLLAETDVPLAQIALESGFGDQSHFSRRFRVSLGMTPRSYRRSRR